MSKVSTSKLLLSSVGLMLCAQVASAQSPSFGGAASSSGVSLSSAGERGGSAAANGGGSGGGSSGGGGGSSNSGNSDPNAVSKQVQTTYDTSPTAGGSDSGDGQKQMEVRNANEITPHMPQVPGPTQTNYHQWHAHAAVTQTKVIFAGGHAIKVDQPLLMEYHWPSQEKPRAQYGYARVIPRSTDVHRNVK